MSALTAVELIAVTKAITGKIAKEARGGIEPGEYNLSFDAHIEGTVRVGEDYEQKITNKAKPWNLVAVLLEELNKTRLAAGETGIDLGKLMTMAEAVNPDMVKTAKKQAEKEAAALKAATLTDCKGKVTADLSVTPLAD